MTFNSLKQNYITGLLETNAFIIKSIEEEPFIKRNGQKSYMFLDHSKAAASPKAYRSFIDVIQYLLAKTYGLYPFILCNVDSKISAQMVGSVAYNLNLPQIVYKSKELTKIEKGTSNQLTGDLDWDLPIAILDDGATGGDGAAKEVGDLVLSTFTNVSNIQLFVGFIRKPSKSTYKTHYVLTFDELIDTMWNRLSNGQKQAIDKERKI